MGSMLIPPLGGRWVPFDGAGGTIYNGALDGPVAAIQSDDFAAGYDYCVMLDGMSTDHATGASIKLDGWYSPENIWRNIASMTNMISPGGVSGIEGPVGVINRSYPRYRPTVGVFGRAGSGKWGSEMGAARPTPQTISKIRMTVTGGANITAGIITLFSKKSEF